jgi:hypothetical protein
MATCSTRATGRRVALIPALCLIAIVTLTACGGSSPSKSDSASSSTPPASSPATSASATSTPPASAPASPGGAATLQGEAADVAKAWETFFDGTTGADQKTSLLQNGDQFQQLIQAQSGSQLAQSVKAQVSDVKVNGDKAAVTYAISIGGQQMLSGQQGEAVKVNGQWKVSDASFCQLLALESGGDTSKLPPACAAAGSASPTA